MSLTDMSSECLSFSKAFFAKLATISLASRHVLFLNGVNRLFLLFVTAFKLRRFFRALSSALLSSSLDLLRLNCSLSKSSFHLEINNWLWVLFLFNVDLTERFITSQGSIDIIRFLVRINFFLWRRMVRFTFGAGFLLWLWLNLFRNLYSHLGSLLLNFVDRLGTASALLDFWWDNFRRYLLWWVAIVTILKSLVVELIWWIADRLIVLLVPLIEVDIHLLVAWYLVGVLIRCGIIIIVEIPTSLTLRNADLSTLNILLFQWVYIEIVEVRSEIVMKWRVREVSWIMSTEIEVINIGWRTIH